MRPFKNIYFPEKKVWPGYVTMFYDVWQQKTMFFLLTLIEDGV